MIYSLKVEQGHITVEINVSWLTVLHLTHFISLAIDKKTENHVFIYCLHQQ